MPPTGSCTSTGPADLSGTIDPEARYRLSRDLADDLDTSLRLRSGGGKLAVDAVFHDPPHENLFHSDLGAHTLPTDGVVEAWTVTKAGTLEAPKTSSGSLALTRVDDRLAGSFTMELTDGTEVDCTFDA